MINAESADCLLHFNKAPLGNEVVAKMKYSYRWDSSASWSWNTEDLPFPNCIEAFRKKILPGKDVAIVLYLAVFFLNDLCIIAPKEKGCRLMNIA